MCLTEVNKRERPTNPFNFVQTSINASGVRRVSAIAMINEGNEYIQAAKYTTDSDPKSTKLIHRNVMNAKCFKNTED